MLYCPTPSGKCEIHPLVCANGKKYDRDCCIRCKGPKYYDQIPIELLRPKNIIGGLFPGTNAHTQGICQKTGASISRDWCARKFKMANIKRSKGEEKRNIGPECIDCNRIENWIIINKENN